MLKQIGLVVLVSVLLCGLAAAPVFAQREGQSEDKPVAGELPANWDTLTIDERINFAESMIGKWRDIKQDLQRRRVALTSEEQAAIDSKVDTAAEKPVRRDVRVR